MNYTRAAQELNLTQPAVSQHIRWLEEQYQAKLFCYENKQLSLTKSGELLRSAAAHHEAGRDLSAQEDPADPPN